MLLIIPLYMLFEQTGGNVPAWVQVVVLGADVVLSMNYIVCALISALHDPLRSEDHLFSGIFFVITVCMAVIVGAQIIPNSSGSVLEPYHKMMSSTSEDGRYSVVFYGEKKNIFSGTDADVYLVSLESDPPERWLVCQFKSESRFQLAWEDNDHFWVNRNSYSVEEIIAAPSEGDK
ncbi:hypothetical protein [Hominenteromicrobium sp.]